MIDRLTRLPLLLSLVLISSCGGGNQGEEHRQSAEELFNATGRPSLVGDFEITNLSVTPNPTTTDWVVFVTFDARFTGQRFPKTGPIATGFVAIRDGQSEIKVFTVAFELTSGEPGNGVYVAKGSGLISTGSAVGVHSFGTRIDPVTNGYAFLGKDDVAQVDVLVTSP